MTEIGLFARALKRHWVPLLTGSLLAAAFWIVGDSSRLTPPLWFRVVVAVLALVPAAFLAWRDEHRRADASERELRELKAAADSVSIPRVTDELYWLLGVCHQQGLRRKMVYPNVGGAKDFPTWIGDNPIYSQGGEWFYQLVSDAIERGWLESKDVPGGVTSYQLTAEAAKILEVSRRQERAFVAPAGRLVDARSGEPVTVSMPV